MKKRLLVSGSSIATATVAIAAAIFAASSSSSTSSSSAFSTPQNPMSTWRVISTNVTVYYGTACIPVEFSGLSCPTINTETHTPSLTNVELISYQGRYYYYDLNFTYYLNGQPATHTFWFTNSTVFCISPNDHNYTYPTCPTRPVQLTTIALGNAWVATSANSSIGLRLELRLSADNVKGSLGITIDERNILDRVNYVTAASGWRISPDNLKDVCYGGYVIGYAVYQGNFGLNNFTQGRPLALMETNARFVCRAPAPQTYYSFQPMSENATISQGQFPTVGSSTSLISISAWVSGYWTGGPAASKFNAFPAGNYTVVAVDQWGQTALLRFTVKNG